MCLQMCNSFSSWEIWSEKLLTDNAPQPKSRLYYHQERIFQSNPWCPASGTFQNYFWCEESRLKNELWIWLFYIGVTKINTRVLIYINVSQINDLWIFCNITEIYLKRNFCCFVLLCSLVLLCIICQEMKTKIHKGCCLLN